MLKKILTLVALWFFSYASWAGASQEAVFAMGCFWCAESEFRDHHSNAFLPGISAIRVGYAGGTQPHPTYEDHQGYKEAIKITFDPTKISYEALLNIFWRNIDPFDANGQFCDQGFPYTAAIFYKDEAQQQQALKTKETRQKSLNKTIVTEIIPFTTFYDAEEYHQNYKQKNPVRYQYYRWRCGRDQRLQNVWSQK